MWYGDARIVCDDMLVNGLNGFGICFYPTHLDREN